MDGSEILGVLDAVGEADHDGGEATSDCDSERTKKQENDEYSNIYEFKRKKKKTWNMSYNVTKLHTNLPKILLWHLVYLEMKSDSGPSLLSLKAMVRRKRV